MGIEEIFRHFGSLFSVFSWWSIAMIAAVVILMIPINMLYKKIMQKESLERLRKIIAFISVYIVSLGVVAGITAIAHGGVELTFAYLSGSTLALGFCAQFAWEVVKLIRDYGFAKVTKYFSEKVDWKKALKAFGKKYNIDTTLTDVIATAIENKYLDQINADAVKAFAENEATMIVEIQNKLTGFVNSGDTKEIATGIFGMLRDAWKATPKQK